MSNNQYAMPSAVREGGAAKIIDLRSDTVTRPGAGMYQAIQGAALGDDVYGEDETVNALEATAAALVEKQAAVFVASGTQSNLIAMLSHCARGEEIIVGDSYHTYTHEAGGASVLGGIAICPLAVDDQGGLHTEQVLAAIKPADAHYAMSRLLCLENTVSGRVQSETAISALATAARDNGLNVHLDGARFFNAMVASGKSAATLAAPLDSISLCLSKGLGAPVGSVLCGSAEFIRRARRWRKMLGGGMRQAGILAACGLYALEHNIERLAEDHNHASLLAEKLNAGGSVQASSYTNMVFLTPPAAEHAGLHAHLAAQGILIGAQTPTMRLVTHLDVRADDIEQVVAAVEAYFH